MLGGAHPALGAQTVAAVGQLNHELSGNMIMHKIPDLPPCEGQDPPGALMQSCHGAILWLPAWQRFRVSSFDWSNLLPMTLRSGSSH
jgi:hypothetical protein